jgi:ligand-binding sensor domain-containing protein
MGGWAVGLALALVVSARPPIGPSAQWRPEERVMLSDFSYVDAVAASPWMVFAATRHGLLIYDRVSRAWKPPVTTLDGYPSSRVRTAIADQAGNAVWLGVGGIDGYVRYDVDARMWTRGIPPPPDAQSQVLTVDAALARAPAADALRSLILTDPRLRSHQFTAAASTPDRTDLFFGTNGMGLVRLDPRTGEWEPLAYGLIAPGVGAIAPADGGIWAATNARPGGVERRGLTWVAADLSATRPTEGGGAALGFTFLVARRLLATAGGLWVATEQGVLQIDAATMRSRTYDVPQATSLAPAPDGVWVGTTRGLSVVTRDGNVERLATDFPVLSLVAVRETLWVGTNAGVVMVPPGKDAAGVAALTQPIYAMTRVRDTIVAATDRSLAWRDPATGTWKELPLSLALGRPTALAADPDGGVWIGGTQGLARADLVRSFVRTLTVPMDLPAPVRDVLADADYLWAATDSGLVRFDRRAARSR